MTVARVIAITIAWLVAALPLEAATLAWDANPEPDIAGYWLSYGTAPGVHTTSIDVGKVLTYNLSAPSGQRYYIVVQAYNSSSVSPKSDEVVLDLTTTLTNQPPTLNQPSNQSGFLGSSPTLALSGSDPEYATLSYSASGLPAGLSVNSASGVIAGTLQTAGSYSVTATVSDGSLSASRSFMWTVSTQPTPTPTPPPAPSDTTPPTVSFTAPLNNQTINGKSVKVKSTASDAGGVRSVRYSVNGNVVSGEITVAPYNYTWDVGSLATGSYQLSARAVDTAGNAGTSTITVTVKTGGNGKKSVSSATTETVDGSDSLEDSPDVPVSGDFDGDGLTDPGAFTASTGEWRLWLSSTRYGATAPLTWGVQGDLPVPADYDGDGRTDLAIFRPSAGTWSIVLSNEGTPLRLDVAWGRLGDNPMPFDYDHDGRADLALRRSVGFDILLSSKNYMESVAVR
jgi:hypothetical protein